MADMSNTNEMPAVRCESANGVATLTLARPAQRNSLSEDMMSTLSATSLPDRRR